MKGRKRYSLGATIADFYVFCFVLSAIAGVYLATANRPVPWWSLYLLGVFGLAVVVVYHVVLAGKTPFRSAGEVMMGRVLVGGRKEWRNPYGISRTALFAVLFFFVTAIFVGDDSGGSAATLTLPMVLVRFVLTGGLLVCVVMFGAGNTKGGVVIATYFALSELGLLLSPPLDIPIVVFYGLMTAVIALFLVRCRRTTASAALQPTGSASSGLA